MSENKEHVVIDNIDGSEMADDASQGVSNGQGSNSNDMHN